MQDVITREITVKATPQRVYEAITNPKEIVRWFPDVVEGGTLEVGQRPVFIFSEQKHRTSIYVESAKPFEYFAYRWIPGGAGLVGDVLTVPNTLVEFIIEATSNGTKVTLRESGFASLPADIAKVSLEENSGGWDYMMGRLEKHLAQS